MNNLGSKKEEERTATLWRVLITVLPTIVTFFRVIISHPLETYKMFKMTGMSKKREKHYWQRDKTEIPYEMPKFEPGMKHCTSQEKYLRPSRYIESDAPEIIAFAHKLGAFRKSDKEYADACFLFMRRSIRFSFSSPLKGALKTLVLGEAMCFDKANLFIALCRAGGVPSRLKTSNTAFTQQIYEPFTMGFPVMKELYDSIGYLTMHTMAEAFVDGKWQVADVSIDDAYQAALELPLSRFGDDSSATWNWEVPGGTLRYESVPLIMAVTMNTSFKLMGDLTLMIQDSWEGGLEQGRKVIAEAGGEEAYDTKIRQTYKAKLPEVSKKLFKLLVEEPVEDVEIEDQVGKILVYDK